VLHVIAPVKLIAAAVDSEIDASDIGDSRRRGHTARRPQILVAHVARKHVRYKH
jgi:hypothetical protein